MTQDESARLDRFERDLAELREIVGLGALGARTPFDAKRAAALIGRSPSSIRRMARGAEWAFRVGGRWEIIREKFVAAFVADIAEQSRRKKV